MEGDPLADKTQQFFSKNPALLGFDDEKALFQAVKELIDNSIDASFQRITQYGAITCSISLLHQLSDKAVGTSNTSNPTNTLLFDRILPLEQYFSRLVSLHLCDSLSVPAAALDKNILAEIVVKDYGVGFSDVHGLATSLFQTTKASDSGTIGQFGIGLKAILLHAGKACDVLPPLLQISTRNMTASTIIGPDSCATHLRNVVDRLDVASASGFILQSTHSLSTPAAPYQHVTMSMRNGVIVHVPYALLPVDASSEGADNIKHTAAGMTPDDTFSTRVTIRFLTSLQSVLYCRQQLLRLSRCLRLTNLPFPVTLSMRVARTMPHLAPASTIPSDNAEDKGRHRWDGHLDDFRENLSLSESITPIAACGSTPSVFASHQYQYHQQLSSSSPSSGVSFLRDVLEHHGCCLRDYPAGELYQSLLRGGISNTHVDVTALSSGMEILYFTYSSSDQGHHHPHNQLELLSGNHNSFPRHQRRQGQYHQQHPHPANLTELDDLHLTRYNPCLDVNSGDGGPHSHATGGGHASDPFVMAQRFYTTNPNHVLQILGSHTHTEREHPRYPHRVVHGPTMSISTIDQEAVKSAVPMPWVMRLLLGFIYAVRAHSPHPAAEGSCHTTHVLVGDLILNDHRLKPVTFPNIKRRRAVANQSCKDGEAPEASHKAKMQQSIDTSINTSTATTTSALPSLSLSLSSSSPSPPSLTSSSPSPRPAVEFSAFSAYPEVHQHINTLPCFSTSSIQCFLAVQTSMEPDESVSHVPLHVSCVLNSTHVLGLNPESEPLLSMLQSNALSHLGLSLTGEDEAQDPATTPRIGFHSLPGTPWLQAWIPKPRSREHRHDADASTAEDRASGGPRDPRDHRGRGQPSHDADDRGTEADNPPPQAEEHAVAIYVMVNLSVMSTSSLFRSFDKSDLFLPSSLRSAVVHCYHTLVCELAERYVHFASGSHSDRHDILHVVAPNIGSTLASIVHGGSESLRQRVTGIGLPSHEHALADELTKMIKTLLESTGEAKYRPCSCWVCAKTYSTVCRSWQRKDVGSCGCNVSLPTQILSLSGGSHGCYCVCHHPYVLALFCRKFLVKLCTYSPHYAQKLFTSSVGIAADGDDMSVVSNHDENIDPNTVPMDHPLPEPSFINKDTSWSSASLANTPAPPPASVEPISMLRFPSFEQDPSPLSVGVIDNPASTTRVESNNITESSGVALTNTPSNVNDRLARIQKKTADLLRNPVQLALNLDTVINQQDHQQDQE